MNITDEIKITHLCKYHWWKICSAPLQTPKLIYQSFSGVLEARLAREATVLSEKDAGVNNILVQLGRDTAIIEAHKLMLKQQQDKVGQIQQVSQALKFLTLS